MYYGWMQAASICVPLALTLYPFMRGVVIANTDPSQVPLISTGNESSVPGQKLLLYSYINPFR